MARHPALAASLTRFLAGPLVRRAFLMRGLAALARNLALLVAVHRRKSAILFCHRLPPHPDMITSPGRLTFPCSSNTRAATDVPRSNPKSQPLNGLGKTFPIELDRFRS